MKSVLLDLGRPFLGCVWIKDLLCRWFLVSLAWICDGNIYRKREEKTNGVMWNRVIDESG